MQSHAEHPNGGGGQVEAPVIELATPVTFQGQTFQSVQLILNERDHVQWGSLVGRSAVVACSPLAHGSLWAHLHVYCQPASIKVEP